MRWTGLPDRRTEFFHSAATAYPVRDRWPRNSRPLANGNAGFPLQTAARLGRRQLVQTQFIEEFTQGTKGVQGLEEGLACPFEEIFSLYRPVGVAQVAVVRILHQRLQGR